MDLVGSIETIIFENKSKLSTKEYIVLMDSLKCIYDKLNVVNNSKCGEKKCEPIDEEIECPICGEYYNPTYYD
jgi:hypothetical protein